MGHFMSSVFDSITDAYDEWYDTPEGHAIVREEAQGLRHLTDDYSGRWLEVGVGTGRFASELGITHGIDPSPRMAAMAKRRGVVAQVGCVEQLPFRDCRFDGVLMALTLCFVMNPELAFLECSRILRNKGWLVVGTIRRTARGARCTSRKAPRGIPSIPTPVFVLLRKPFITPNKRTSACEKVAVRFLVNLTVDRPTFQE